jgi:hypothetical protein
MIERAKKLIKINKEAWRRSVEINSFKKQYQSDWDCFDSHVKNNASPVFVLSTGRCGTEFLTNILSINEHSLVYHSPSPKLLYADRLAFERKSDDFLMGALVASRFQLIAEAVMRDKKFVETNCRSTYLASAIESFFPKASFIHLIRSPEGYLKSGLGLDFYGGRFNDYSRIRSENTNMWASFDQSEKILWSWNETNRFVEEFKQKNPAKVLTIYSEELFEDLSVVRNVLNFCYQDFELDSSKLHKVISSKVNAKTSQKRNIGNLNLKNHISRAYMKGILSCVDDYADLTRYKPDV